MTSQKPLIVGISGGSAAGKTTVANLMAEKLAEFNPSILGVDRYFKDHSDLTDEEKAGLNYDIPEALDFVQLAEDLEALRQGRPARVPEYDYANHSSIPAAAAIEPSRIVIVEGILLFHPADIKPLIGYRIYVEAQREERLRRRIARDVAERGRSQESVIRQFNGTVEPAYLEYTAPTRGEADYILAWDAMNHEAIGHVCALIRAKML